MTISNSNIRNLTTGDGVAKTFSYTSKITTKEELEVYVDGVKKALGSDYDVTNVAAEIGGSVVFVVAPAMGAKIVFVRNTPRTQEVQFSNNGATFSADTFERLADKLTAVDQEQEETLRRSVKIALDHPGDAPTLPSPQAGRALKWDADGKLVNTTSDIDTVVATVNANTTTLANAAAAAEAAAASAVAAKVAAISAAEQAQAAAEAVGDPLSKAANLGDLPDPTAARANLGLAAVAASGAYADLLGLPELGSAAAATLGTAPGQVPTADQVPALVQGVPTGCITPFAGAVAPDGWLLCDGSVVSRSDYAALFSVIGTIYGAGDGSTTFNLPDLRGRAPIGAGQGSGLSNRTLGTKLGAETHTLSISEMPSHTHQNNLQNYVSLGGESSGGTARGGAYNIPYGNVGYTGGGGAHNNMQPSLVLNFIIKT